MNENVSNIVSSKSQNINIMQEAGYNQQNTANPTAIINKRPNTNQTVNEYNNNHNRQQDVEIQEIDLNNPTESVISENRINNYTSAGQQALQMIAGTIRGILQRVSGAENQNVTQPTYETPDIPQTIEVDNGSEKNQGRRSSSQDTETDIARPISELNSDVDYGPLNIMRDNNLKKENDHSNNAASLDSLVEISKDNNTNLQNENNTLSNDFVNQNAFDAQTINTNTANETNEINDSFNDFDNSNNSNNNIIENLTLGESNSNNNNSLENYINSQDGNISVSNIVNNSQTNIDNLSAFNSTIRH